MLTMRGMQEPPLDARELRILRGLIDDHVYKVRQRARWTTTFGDARLFVAALGGLAVLILNGVELYLIATGRR